MRYFIPILIVMLTMTGCFERGKAKAQLIKTLYNNRVSTTTIDDPDPAAGTLLSWGCDGYTRLNEIANGQGGSTTERIEKSSDCDWNPPEAGTVSETRCDEPYTLVTVFNDGEYGFYEEEQEKSEDCGYSPPVATMVKGSGDRFDPVMFTIEYSDTADDLEYEATSGRVVETESGLEIYSEGRLGTHTIVIAGEEFRYDLIEEPRCQDQGGDYGFSADGDCQGYVYNGPNRGFIYYGEEDTRVVEWELAYLLFEGRGTQCGEIVELFEKGSDKWNRAQQEVDKYNEWYEKSGVHVRYVLKEGAVGRASWCSNPGGAGAIVRSFNTADIYIAKGSTCPDTCGCAYASRGFGFNNGFAVGGVSVCGTRTDLHEIGHGVGLAHGPDNSSNAGTGYIWPEFGHGHSGGILCGSDIMSYANGATHLNSLITCNEMYGEQRNDTNPTGDRTISDTAYHLNRVRYDVSLIHCKEDTCSDEASKDETPVYQEEILIEDKIDDIPNGRQLRQQELDKIERVFGAGAKIQ